MHKPLISLIVASVVPLETQLTLAAETEPVVTSAPQFRPVTMAPDRPTSARLIANVERALSRYAAGCETPEENAIADVFTSFAVIEYASSIAGHFVGSDAIAAERCWAASALTSTGLEESPIWIYPTSEANDVLIQYTVVIGTGAAQRKVQDIALVEMAGDRIARIRDYMSPVDSVFQSDLVKE
jgi:hypothetical protein